MIRVLFDHQCNINNNLWENRYFDLLIEELNKDEEFDAFKASNIEETMILLKDNNHFDIFCPTGINNYYLRKLQNDKKLCIHIHHMIYELFSNKVDNNLSDLSKYIKIKAEQIFLTNEIIVPSVKTKEHFNLFYKYFDELTPITNKVNIIPYGISINDNVIDEKPLFDYPYILYTNNRFDMIDYHLLKKTIIILSDWLKDNNINFVIAGNHITNDILDIIKINNLEKYICYYNISNHNELNNLYYNSICQICPEIIDSFGYTILEGWNNNCLTLVNEKNMLYAELCDNAALYFNFDNLVDRLNIILNINMELHSELISRQREQLQKYDIKNHINLYKTLFKKMLEK